MQDPVNSRDVLKSAPTVFGWSVELQRVLNGERELSLLRLQSVQAYIDKLIELSEDESLSRACFQEALGHVVHSWQPNEKRSQEYTAIMLDLIGAYKPLEGASRIAALLKDWGTFSKSIQTSGGYGADVDLNLKALAVLGEFFRVAPHEKLINESSFFRSYAEILFEYFRTPRYGGYVASRLIDLGLIDFADPRIGQLLQMQPEALYELVSLLFSDGRRSRLTNDLPLLAAQVLPLSDKAQDLFEQAVKSHGGSVDDILADTELSVQLSAAASSGTATSPNSLNVQISHLPTLLRKRDEQSLKAVVATFEQCLNSGFSRIESFESKLREVGGSLDHTSDSVEIVLDDEKRLKPQLNDELLVRYIGWRSWQRDIPSKEEIQQELAAAI